MEDMISGNQDILLLFPGNWHLDPHAPFDADLRLCSRGLYNYFCAVYSLLCEFIRKTFFYIYVVLTDCERYSELDSEEFSGRAYQEVGMATA